MEQKVIMAGMDYGELDDYIQENGIRSMLLVCGQSFANLKISSYFEKLEAGGKVNVVRFDDFTPNPGYESVERGVEVFRQNNCSAIIAVGGGSAMDVAKCIKLYANMDPAKNYLEQEIVPNDVKLLAVPTTAGTGSEATRYAVIYYRGEKQSVTDDSCIPDVVLVDPSALKTLPMYQRKATMLDALCHAVESFWSVNSTEESKAYSKEAIRLILDDQDAYLANQDRGNANMLQAANIAGKAINITQTTAGHAMCYKLTSLYGIAHGHAAALCVSALWEYMPVHAGECIDPRGADYVTAMFKELADVMGCSTAEQAAVKFREIFAALDLAIPIGKEEDFEILRTSVNPVRLKNNPIRLDEKTIDMLYHKILSVGAEG
ncbi:MAG: phosphonoacetaldehyde reductase [Acetatifactor sp.]|nr:phosphonoacetaldehyde reductase [Acetatifactor sp.]